MYKLVIVDDESIIRRGLANFIDWVDMGFELVDSFEDGKETIDFLKSHDVDVVLTDIRMSEVSGLELAEYIHENKPQIKVVILSGYKEFDYAKQAVDYDVEHYLLKPARFDEVVRIFTNIKTKLDKEAADRKMQKSNTRKYQEMIPILREQFFVDLIMGVLRNEKEILRRIQLIDLPHKLMDGFCCIMDVQIKNYDDYLKQKWDYGKEKLNMALRNFLNREMDGITMYAVFNTYHELKVVALSQDMMEKEFGIYLEDYVEDITESMKKTLGLSVAVEREECFQNIYALSTYSQPWQIHNHDSDVQGEIHLETSEYERLVQKYKLFMSAISDVNFDDVNNLLDSFMEEIKALPIRYVHHFIIGLFAMISNKFAEIGIDLWKITQGQFDYQTIVRIRDIDAITSWSKGHLNSIIKHIQQQKETSSQQITKKAMKYINEHYNQDLSLEDVADSVFLNPIYFSRFFKSETGETFTDYLTKVRMKRAIDLLLQNKYKTYEISEMVGYKSSKYFSKVFKQFTGYTPKEYFRSVMKESETGYVDEE